jgi:hypothetical protein
MLAMQKKKCYNSRVKVMLSRSESGLCPLSFCIVLKMGLKIGLKTKLNKKG